MPRRGHGRGRSARTRSHAPGSPRRRALARPAPRRARRAGLLGQRDHLRRIAVEHLVLGDLVLVVDVGRSLLRRQHHVEVEVDRVHALSARPTPAPSSCRRTSHPLPGARNVATQPAPPPAPGRGTTPPAPPCVEDAPGRLMWVPVAIPSHTPCSSSPSHRAVQLPVRLPAPLVITTRTWSPGSSMDPVYPNTTAVYDAGVPGHRGDMTGPSPGALARFEQVTPPTRGGCSATRCAARASRRTPRTSSPRRSSSRCAGRRHTGRAADPPLAVRRRARSSPTSVAAVSPHHLGERLRDQLAAQAARPGRDRSRTCRPRPTARRGSARRSGRCSSSARGGPRAPRDRRGAGHLAGRRARATHPGALGREKRSGRAGHLPTSHLTPKDPMTSPTEQPSHRSTTAASPRFPSTRASPAPRRARRHDPGGGRAQTRRRWPIALQRPPRWPWSRRPGYLAGRSPEATPATPVEPPRPPPRVHDSIRRRPWSHRLRRSLRRSPQWSPAPGRAPARTPCSRPPGWTVEADSVSSSPGYGVEVTDVAGGQRLTLMWVREKWFASMVADAERETTASTLEVLGEQATYVTYESQQQMAFLPVVDGYGLRVDGAFTTPSTFEALVGEVRAVDETGFSTSLPADIVTPATSDRVTQQMLDAVDAAAGTVVHAPAGYNGRYQVAAGVIGTVGCSWLHRWSTVTKPRDRGRGGPGRQPGLGPARRRPAAAGLVRHHGPDDAARRPRRPGPRIRRLPGPALTEEQRERPRQRSRGPPRPPRPDDRRQLRTLPSL